MGLGASDSRELHPALARLPGHLVWRAAARVTAALDRLLPAGVDIHAWAVLLALGDGVARSQQELADIVSISRTTMARVATDLVAAGLVERVRNPADRRSYALTRTHAGAGAARSWRGHADQVEAALTGGMDPGDATELHDLVLRLVADDLSPEAPPALVRSTGFLLSRLHASMHRIFLDALTPVGLEPRLFGSLKALTATGPTPQAELARTLGTSAATLVQIADDLEAVGLVERRRDPGDRRAQLLHLTDRAPDVVAEADRVARRTADEVLAALGPAERDRFVELLAAFVSAPTQHP